MKRFSTFSCLLLMGILLSCNNNETVKSETASDSTKVSADTMKMAPMPANTIVTTPETVLTVMHHVKNFATWVSSFDNHDSMRLAAGLHAYVVSRLVSDSNTVLLSLKVDDMKKAKAFVGSASLKIAMQKGGVVGAPKMEFNTFVWQDTGKTDNKLRSRVEYTVKDYDAWKKVFDSTKSVRMANGLADRVVAHTESNNKKILLILAVNDTAKAKAFNTSDQLKQIRVLGGVVGPVDQFLFTIVKRY